MIQTHWVIERLRQHWSNLEITIEQIRTTGDRITDVPLASIGGDGVFVTEIERALSERRIDLAIHSLKDLPTAQPDGMHVVVTGPREDVRDAFVSNTPFQISPDGLFPVGPTEQLNASLRIGTCSLRRTAQVRWLCPNAEILPLRGNVDTRLRKLEAGNYDGILLAAAGLHRMDLQEHLAQRLAYFPAELLLPAPGQGALGLEIRDEPQWHELLAPLHDPAVQAATGAERMFMRRLGAGCYLPVAAYGKIIDGLLILHGLVISLDGQQRIHVSQQMPWTQETSIEHAEQLGITMAEDALAQGADEIISIVNSSREQEQHQRV
jgi:hydroxymethylbilane synthase